MASLALGILRSTAVHSTRGVHLLPCAAAASSTGFGPARRWLKGRNFATNPTDEEKKQFPNNQESSNRDSSPLANDPLKSSTDADTPPPPPLPRQRQAYASLDFEPVQESEEASSERSLITDGSRSTGEAGELEGRKHRTGAKSAKDSRSSIEKRRSRMGKISAYGLLGVLIGSYIWAGREDEDGKVEGGIGAWISRSNKNTMKMFDLFSKPIWDKLLPDPLPEPYQRPYTLLLSIDDLLVASTWDRQNGWRTAKRPGVDYFLGYLSQFFEIVIFTSQSVQTSGPIIDQLDPYQARIMYHLFREATKSHNGTIVKDISYLNRDLSKVIAIDTAAERYALQPDNVIVLPKWKPGTKGRGEHGEGDLGLIGLIPFLESVVFYNTSDVRPILKAYQGRDIASEYAKVEAGIKKKFIEEWSAKRGKTGGLSSGGWSIGRLSGATPPPPKEPMTFLEQKRAFAQRTYQEDLERLEAEKETLDKQKKLLMEQAQKEMMEGGMFGALRRMGLGPPPETPSPPPTEKPADATPKSSN
ncbi:mitochondrial inner membrane protein required for protein import [Serendipita sp. 399]|nr:mitochondrial inner membrane protein required for protein import [Serendipita sp. 399]